MSAQAGRLVSGGVQRKQVRRISGADAARHATSPTGDGDGDANYVQAERQAVKARQGECSEGETGRCRGGCIYHVSHPSATRETRQDKPGRPTAVAAHKIDRARAMLPPSRGNLSKAAEDASGLTFTALPPSRLFTPLHASSRPFTPPRPAHQHVPAAVPTAVWAPTGWTRAVREAMLAASEASLRR